MKLGIIAGEPSGDLLGAGLIHALATSHASIQSTGMGGQAMLAAGCHSLYPMEKLSVMGLLEPLKHLPELFRIRRHLYRHFMQDKPDVFVGIDSPDFNLGLEIKLRQAGIPIVHYVSPSVWAWRKKRIFKIAKAVDLMLTLLPFEADFYQQHNVPVCFVGHPLADQIPLQIDKTAARQRLGIDPHATYIAVLPGSRRQEIKHLGALFIATAAACLKKNANLRFISSAVNGARYQEFQQQRHGSAIPLTVFINQTHDVMAAADVVLVASGTATLETMLFKRPMVIAYRTSELTYQIAKRIVKLPCFGLPNLLAKEMVVPEFLQHDATPENLSKALLAFVDDPDKVVMLEKKFLQLHQVLRCDANRRAAEAVMQVMARKS